MYNEKVLCAGFGGQGVMSLGQLLAYAGMIEGKHVSWMPSYGPEMRGGTAYCNVMVSDTPVGSPIIGDDATCAIVMNQPSLTKFETSVAPGGLLLVNSSLIEATASRKDIDVHYIPAVELATESGNDRAANMVMLGAYLELTGVVQQENITKAFKKVFGSKAAKLLPVNIRALKNGAMTVVASKGETSLSRAVG